MFIIPRPIPIRLLAIAAAIAAGAFGYQRL